MTRKTRSRRTAGIAVTALLALTGITACGSSHDSGSSSASSSGSAQSSPSGSASSSSHSKGSDSSKTAAITITNYKYDGPASVAPGTKITITNKDSEAHTVTADRGHAFDVTIPPGKSATLTAPSKAGSYAYHCIYHSNMHGTLKVT